MKKEKIAGGCLRLSILLGMLSCFVTCFEPAGSSKEEKELSPETIQEVLEAHNQELLSIPNVVGTARSLCEGKPCILVMVSEKNPSLEQKILSILKGYPVRIEKTGAVRPLPSK